MTCLSALALVHCAPETETADPPITAEKAAQFMADAEQTLAENSEFSSHVSWVNANFITYDTNWLKARVGARVKAEAVRLANATKQFQGLDLPPELRRKMDMLRGGITIPAPEKPGAAEELSGITTSLSTTYSTGKGTYQGAVTPGVDLEELMATVRSDAALKEMWTSWREISKPMKSEYARMVEIANEGARELGYGDVGQMWRSGYDMDPDAFVAMVERLWSDVAPLYEELHCYVRAELSGHYGADVVPQEGPIPAHVLGNMWAQQWGNIYELIAPEEAGAPFDGTVVLQEAGYDALKMVQAGEAFFSSLGFDPLPQTFWERSLITKPQDREVVCHASAWNIDDEDDIRIKMCTKVNADDFQTVHHELGHNYYQRAYKAKDYLYRTGANDGFHEAIGDMIGLSVTPEYMVQIGLLDAADVPPAEADLGLLLQSALDKVAFLPFGLLIDKWRWQVFSGAVSPDDYNEAWWALRTRYQGVVPPVDRPGDAFDPGAKYHIPGNTPYMRYFLARILQFQFHKTACDMVGWEGPLHRCSIYGSAAVGEAFNAMLELGASKPWPDALEAFTGTREMDATALLEYYAPVADFLNKENAGRSCGW
ncbi:MAG: M2 family metallopeptidase [Pseudomonadota bacterium]